MTLWGGRFTQAANQRFKQLNDSLRFDYLLAEQEIISSMAWSKALVDGQGIDRGGATVARAGARRANGRGAGLIHRRSLTAIRKTFTVGWSKS